MKWLQRKSGTRRILWSAAGSLRAVVCVWVCACVCVCREKASLLVYGSAPWELRWGVAVKDSSPIPGFPPGVLVSFHPTPPSAASPCLSAPDAPRNLRISLSFRNITGRTGPLLSRAESCSWDRLQGGEGEWAWVWSDMGRARRKSPPRTTSHALNHTHMQHTQRHMHRC